MDRPIERIGDVATIIQGDALTVLRDLPGESVDAVVTDPPYSSGGMTLTARQADPATKYQTSGTKRSYPAMLGDNKDQRSFTTWATLWLTECWRMARDGAPLLVFTDWRQLPSTTDAVQAAGWLWRGLVVWHKPSARPLLGEFRRDAEFLVYAVKRKANPATRNCLPGVMRHSVNPAEKVHLTGKPVALLRDLLAVTQPGGLVLDPFTGGGTTGMACMATGRRFLGVELSPEYHRIAADRIAAAHHDTLATE
ncbi:DNA-methyltransferase [Nitratidesulfovibrio termitidis]|uniref:DNA-methyltransferase n=1 Tax=Nitratidesulfovibrio termitidis TaxID=42252 RepID=UPI000422742B|nr:site-specific DNA-methyltransferase [Nitratidesulfovibrio termitidis]